MITLHDVAAIRAAEHAHSDELNSGVLMDRAAHGVSAAVIDLLQQVFGRVVGSRVVLLVGPGNNGGDALFAGAKLLRRGVRASAITSSSRFHPGGAEAFTSAGGLLMPWSAEALADLQAADLIIDGLLGIGAVGDLRAPMDEIVAATRSARGLIVSVDVPTGVDADTGAIANEVVDADQTVTFGGVKPGLLVNPGKEFCGGVRLVDIGITDALDVCGGCLDANDVALWIPEADASDYKYRRGVVGLLAGSERYPGAAFLTTAAALCADIGMVEYFDRGDGLARDVVMAHPPIVTTFADPASNSRVRAWVAGPGFSGTAHDAEAVHAVLRCSVPVVLDAGALTVIAADESLRAAVIAREFPTIITPHEGEFARLSDADLASNRLGAAFECARALNVIVVLKGSGTIVVSPEGILFIDVLGTPALATAGSGDVLSGLMGALLAGAVARSGVDIDDTTATEVAAAAVWLHSEAGRIASQGGLPVTAHQIVQALPAAVAAVRRPGRMGS